MKTTQWMLTSLADGQMEWTALRQQTDDTTVQQAWRQHN